MHKSSIEPSFMRGGRTRRQEKPTGQTASETAGEGAARLGRFGGVLGDKKKGEDVVARIQNYAKSENERKKKEEEEKKKAAGTKSTAPSRGFFGKMMDKYVYGKKEEQ